MEQQKFISATQDAKVTNIADVAEDQLIRVYVYEMSNKDRVGSVMVAPSSISVVAIQNVTNSLEESARRLQLDENGDAYFEILAEETISGELKKVSKTDLMEYRFVNVSRFVGISNQFVSNSGDTAKLFTIREPFDYDAYMAGTQAVYYAVLDPQIEYDKKELENIVDAEKYLISNENVLTSIDLRDTQEWEKQNPNSKIAFVLGNYDLNNPKVNVSFGQYHLNKDTSTYGENADATPRPDYKGKDGKMYIEYINQNTGNVLYDRQAIFYNAQHSFTSATGKWDEITLDVHNIQHGIDAALTHQNHLERFITVVEDSDSTNNDVANSFYNEILLNLKEPTAAKPYVEVYEQLLGLDVYNAKKNEFTSRTLTIVRQGYGNVDIKVGALCTQEGDAATKKFVQFRIIAADEIDAYLNDLWQEDKILDGLQIRTDSTALMSRITARAFTNWGKTDLNLKTSGHLMPIMIKIANIDDSVTIEVPWFDTDVVTPFYMLQEFFGHIGGASLTTLISDQSDRNLIYDMMAVTKAYMDKFKDFPISQIEEDKGKINSETKLGWEANLKVPLLVGQTAIQVNDGLFKNWQETQLLDDTNERVIKMKNVICLLSRYIAVSKAISGGATSFANKYLPYYLKIATGMLLGAVNAEGDKDTDGLSYKLVTADEDNPQEYALPDNIHFTIESNHFELFGQTRSFNTKLNPNISDIQYIKDDGKYILPPFPDVLSQQKINITPAHINPNLEDALSYIAYLPIQNLLAIKRLFLDTEKIEQTIPTEGIIKTFDLPGTYYEPLSVDVLESKIHDYVFEKFGLHIDNTNVIITAQPTRDILTHQDHLQEKISQGEHRHYPTWLSDATGYTTGYDEERAGRRGALGVHGGRSLIKPIWREWAGTTLGSNDMDLTLEEMKKVTHNLNPSFPVEHIIIDNDDIHTVRKIWFNFNMFETSYRWYDLDWLWRVVRYKYSNIQIKIKSGTFLETSINNRQIMFTKTEWNDFIRGLNQLNGEIFNDIETTYTLYTNKPINYITNIDLRFLFVNSFTLIINGIEFELPAYNKDQETLTFQKILLQ